MNKYQSLLFLIFINAMILNADETVSNEEWFSSYKQAYIPADKIESLQESALKGNKEDAYRIENFYAFAEYNEQKADYWLKIAAENGHPSAQYNFGQRLERSSDPVDKKRAYFWYKKAAEGGFPNAYEKVKELEKKTHMPVKRE